MKNCTLCNRPCGAVLFKVTRFRQASDSISQHIRLVHEHYEPEWICEQCWTEAQNWFVPGEKAMGAGRALDLQKRGDCQ
jgi:hypothetical protein